MNTNRGALQKRIMKTIWLLIFIPMVLLAVIAIVQLNALGQVIGTQGARSLENERVAILPNKTADAGEFVNGYLEKVEFNLHRLGNYQKGLLDGNISVLENRPSFAQSDIPPDLVYSARYGKKISNQYSDFVNTTIIDSNMEDLINKTAYMDYIFASIYENNSAYCSITFVYNNFSRVYPFIEDGRPLGQNLKLTSWYLQAISKTGNISYYGPQTGLISSMVFVAKAVYNSQNQLIGVVAIELDLTPLRNAFANLTFYNSGYLALIDGSGNAWTHPSLSKSQPTNSIVNLEAQDITNTGILTNIAQQKSGNASFNKDNEKIYIAFSPVNRANLHVVAFVAEEDVITPGIKLQAAISKLVNPSIISYLVLIIVLIGGLTFATVLISKRITRPINELTTSVERMSKGDLTQEIAIDRSYRGNEIGVMAQSFQNLLVTMRLGNKSYYQGDLIIAFKNYQAALELFNTVGNLKGIGTCLNNLGNIYRNWGDYTKAKESYDQAIQIGKELNDLAGLAARYNNRGLLYLNLSEWTNAKNDFEQAMEIDRKLSDDSRVAMRKRNLGVLYLLQKIEAQARTYLDEALQLDYELENDPGIAEDHFQLGRVDMLINDLDKAESHFRDALKKAEPLQNYPLMRDIFKQLMIIYSEKRNAPYLEKATAEYNKINDTLVTPKDVIFVIDLSGSMDEQGKMKSAKKGAKEVFELAINGRDTVAIIGFHSYIENKLAMTEKGPNIAVIEEAFDSLNATPYMTRFYDAVATAISMLQNRPPERARWVVALTDGFDNSSTDYNPDKLIKYLKSLARPINLILIGVGPELQQVAPDFTRIVEASSRGKYIPIYSSKNMGNLIEKAFKTVQEIMASAEIEGFTPQGA
jgi:tetratricopeptide (TPR) repeat protein